MLAKSLLVHACMQKSPGACKQHPPGACVHACRTSPLHPGARKPCSTATHTCKPCNIATWVHKPYTDCMLQVDGERFTLPLVLEDQKLHIGQEGTNLVLHTTSGLRLLYNAATYLLVTIPSAYRGRVCGLGGNFNGDPGDDFILPDGSPAKSTEEFVTSWKTPPADGGCTEGCGGKPCPTCDAAAVAPYGSGDKCGIIHDPTGPFGSCHHRVNPVQYFQHCLHDVCAANGARDALCHSLQAYAAACQAAGAEIGGWRTAAFCRKWSQVSPNHPLNIPKRNAQVPFFLLIRISLQQNFAAGASYVVVVVAVLGANIGYLDQDVA